MSKKVKGQFFMKNIDGLCRATAINNAMGREVVTVRSFNKECDAFSLEYNGVARDDFMFTDNNDNII